METDALLHGARAYARSYASTATTSSHVTLSDQRAGLGLAVPAQIDNAGSTARDMYASERNYLSWVRLSAAIMGTGAVVLADISQLHNPFSGDVERRRLYFWLVEWLETYDEAVGLALFALAAGVLLAALAVFAHASAQLAVARRPLRWSQALLVAMTAAVAASALVVSATGAFLR
ncbi:hypothetical protein IWW55_003325 [Coemansia sp. RSA 2706]|nr:hypothetical protein LPJ63_004534 [Coemansia sp. RSA 2711]KAJ2302636.1 hypothetical protein IWW55_003325 [Coemansia sp. RSA 2706]KAJ2306375.1 hypothetical protein IWW52_006237 [Coemansia sp. RSA 2704]KAJ2307130.1 hypothetical protein IWW54_004495 [Coemansia sp. RSA 2705]KAJ2324519.1 hypothetical protein IWW51_003237 [Coemansia sp. RSA 2702]KAJ2728900.1 hypothetical protein H4R23_003565 [Coemansia sp. Cherry 401B]